ncbi:DUF1542 domain-containing protein [uncultured Fructobacillus sp.]|uniref:DUF1542 domain-containing protein n=1 Tax=uncultured Fructobacillus sp. TaxID=591942 RepID=UPI002597DE20|nr:DUF1542 domain-containing protein [uncultured Fructobacillus sp.]
MTIPNGPATDYYALDRILVNGQTVTAGSDYTITNGSNLLTYIYRSLDGEKDSAKAAIDNAAQAAIQKINGVTNLTADQITAAVKAVQENQDNTKSAITAAKSESDITTNLNSGLLNMSRNAASLVIDGSAQEQNDAIAALKFLSADQKAKYEQAVTDDANALKADLNSNAANPSDVQAKQDAATTKLSGDESKAELDDYGTNILNQIKQMPALTDQQKADAATAVQGIVGNGQNLIGVKTMLSDIMTALQASKASLNDEKNKAQGESDAAMTQIRKDYVDMLEQYVVQADAQIDSLTLIDKDDAKETVRQTADAAKAKINSAADQVSVINAEGNGEVAIAKNTADSTIDNATFAAENKVLALNNLQSGDKAAAKTNIESLQTSAKNNIASALHTTDVTTALTNGTNSIAQKASATVIQDAVAGADSAIDALKTMSATEKQSFKDKITSDATTYSNNLTAATNGSDIQTVENNGVAVIQADIASAVLKDYQENADNQLDAFALNATNAVSALPNLDKSTYLANIATDVKNGKAAIDGASSSSSVDDALGTAKRSIDCEQAAATLKSAQNVANAAVNAAAQSVNAVIGNLKPLDPAEIIKYQDQVNDVVTNATTQINGEPLPATVSSNQASAISKINGIRDAASLQNAKEAVIAVAKQAAADAKTTISNFKSLKPEEVTKYQGQVDVALQAVTSQINSETTTDAVTSDQTTFTNTTLPNMTSAANLQNAKEDDNAQLDSYAQNAKNNIADKTVMPDLTLDQISDYSKQVDTAVLTCKSSINGGQDTTTVAANFQAAKDSIDKIKATAQAESDVIVSQAKSDADNAIDQSVTAAQADVQKLSPLSDQAARLAAIKNDGDAAKAKIAADKNTADISSDQVAGLQAITDDKNAAILQSAKEGAIAAVTKINQGVKTTIGNMKPLDSKEILTYQNQVDGVLTAATTQINKETTVSSVTSDQTSFTSQINGIQDTATLQNTKENDNNQLGQYAQSVKNAIADKTGMPDLTPDQISDYDKQIDTAVLTGKSSINDGQDTTTVATNFQTTKDNIDKIQAAAQAQSTATVSAARGAANTAIDQAVANVQATVQKLDPLKDQAARLAAIKSNGDGAKAKIAADANTASINADRDAGLNTIQADQNAATLESAKEEAIAVTTQAVIDAKTAISNLKPLKPEEVTEYQGQADTALQAVTNQINSETTTDAVTSDQTTFTNTTLPNIKNAASLQNAKDAAIAVATQNATDAKTAIGGLKSLQPDEITNYQGQVDSALSDATTQINQETTIAAVLSDQDGATTKISGIQNAAELQNTKENDNTQLDQYAQNAKNAIADKTGMPDLTPEQISDYDNQIDTAVSTGKSSINGGQDTTTVATNFQTAKNNIDKIQAKAQAHSNAIVSEARDAANNAIDQAVMTAQAAVQKLNPLKDQATRLAQIQKDGNSAKAKIAADANTASIIADRDTGLNTIQADRDAATLESAKEAAIATVTQAAAATKTAIGALQPLQPSEIKNFQDQVDGAVTAATSQINSETTTDAVASDQANAIINTIAGIQTAASLQSIKEKDNAQLLQDGQTAKNKIAAMPDLTKDQIAQANSDIDSAVSNGQTAITGSQNEADVETNFQTAESNINKVTATAQSQSDNTVANAKTAAGDVLDKAATAAKAAIDQLPVLKADEKADFKSKIDAAVTAAKNSIQNDTTVAAVTADQNNGLTAISSQQAAATLQNAKEDSINQLTAYAQGGRTALTKLPNLTDAQADQANTSITSAVTNGTTSINAARDLAGVTRALVSAESAVNRAGVIAVNQSNAALVSARTAAEAAINAVAAAVKTTINNLSPLSDQQARLSQVDTDIVNAKTALESTSATADVTAAQGKAIARLNADVANAQQKSSQEDTISRLRNYATNAETAIAEMPALSADNLTTAKAAIESAVANGDSNIQGASEHAAMANVLIAAEQTIDAAATIAQNQSQQILAQAQSDASAAIDAALIVAQQKLNNLSLSADDQAAQEKQLENDSGSAKININAATSLAAVTQAQQTGAQTINQDILSAEIVSLQTEAKKRLQAYADQTKQTISSLHDLPSDSYTNAYKGVDALVKIWSGNIVNTRNLADMQSALYSGATAINLVSLSAQANSQKVLDQERAAAETAINQAAATARQTINDLSPLSDKSARLDQIDQDVKDADDALDAATNNQGFIAAQNAGTAAITTHVTAAQLKSAQEQADADLATYGQNIYAQIAALPDLTATQRQQASTDITNAVSQGKTAIDATTSQSDVAPAFATAEKVIDGIQDAAQGNNQTAVKQSQSAAGAIIDVAAKAAKATVDNLSPLSDKQDREAQIDTDAKNAKDEIAKATTKADVTAAQNAGTTTITNDTTAAQLQSAQEQADADLATYGQNAKNAIKAMPDLSDDQRKQANDDIDAAVSADQTQQINAATDANGVATALVAGKSAVDKVQATAQSQSDAAVQQDRDDADDTIDAAVKQAKATINSLNPLSDKAKRLAQVDTDADSAKNAVAQANNKTDITTAQNAGIATITQDAADAQLKSTKETNDATLAAYGQTAKDAIAKMPDLTTAQIDQANKDVDAAILAGQGQIDVAPDASAAATALTNGEKAVDAVQAGTQNTSNTTVQQERDAAAVAIDAAVKNANDAIEGMKTLADTATPEGNVAAAAQAAKDAIAKAGNKTAIMAAQNSGTAAITNETTAAQLQSTKEATIATLTQTAQAAKDAIKVMPDLNTDQIAAANAAVDAAFNDGQSKINAATDDDGVSTALTNGETGIKNAQAAAQAESDAIVAQERSAAKAAIDTAAQQATDKIDAMTPLSDKQSREDQVAKDAQNAKTAIDQAKNKVAITAAQTSGTDAINNEVAAAQLQSTKETDNNTLTADGHTTKDAIGKMPDLTPDQVTAFDSQIDAAVKAAQGQIDAARDANSVATAFATGETNIQNIQQDAQNTSDAKVASERLTANNAIDAAMKAAKTAIEGMNPLADKTTPESQVDAAAQAAKAAIAGAKKQTDITAAQNSGIDAIDKVTAGAQLQSKKEAAKATLVQHGADAKAAIAAVPDLTDDQRKQANSAIDAAVKTGQGNIDGAADAAGVGTALQNGEAAVDAVTATAKTNSATTVANEKKTASDAIDAAAAKAKAAIDAMNPLSDKADREAQVDRDAAAAKTAINSATNAADITKAQNNGTVALNTDTANAQLMSTKEAADAELTKYGQDAKDKIVAMSDLTNDQIDQANSEIAAAVKAGQASIDAAAAANAVVTALKNGEAAVNAVQTKSQSSSDAIVKTAKDAANSAIDDAAAKAKATIDALNPLSDKSDREAQVDKDAAAAKQKMAHDTTTEQVTVDQNSGLNAINNDVTAAQVKSAQEDATVRLWAYADNAEAAIAKLPDLPADDLADAKAKIEAAIDAGNKAITAAQTIDNVKSALTTAEQAIDGVSTTAQGQSNQVVSDAKQDAKNAIADAAAKSKATIENLTPLSEDEKQAKEAHVDQDAKDATQNIDNATDTDAITQAKQTGINNINQDVLNSQIENVQRDVAARLLAYANQAKRTIVALPDLTKDQIDQANADIDAKVKTWTNNINQAQNLADVQTALVDGEKAIDDTSLTSQRQSQQTVTKEKNAANSVINDAAAKAKTAIDGLTPLSDKAAREAQIDMDAQNAKTAIAKATNKADIDTAQKAGTDTLNTDTVAAQLKSQKEAADAELTKYGQDAKAAIAKLPDLTPDQIKQANADINAAVKAGQGQIDAATDADSVATALKNGEVAVDAVKASAKTNSETTVDKEKAATNKIIDDAAAKAKAAIDGLTPLSDKAAREARIDMDAQNAKAAIAKATNATDIDTAQKAGTDTLNTDTVAAQLKSQKEAADADLAKYGQSTKTTIQKLPDLTPDQVMKANGNIDDAVKKGQNQIDVATDADGVTTGLNNGKAAIDKIAADAASASSQVVAKARTQAKTAIDNAGGQAKATIDGLTALVDAQKGADQAKVDQDAATAKDKIDQATTTQAIKHALDDGLVTIQKDVENSILDNTKGEADSQLAGYAQTAKDKIVQLPNLTPEEIDQANREIDEIVAQGKKAIGQAAAENEVKVAVKTNKEKSDDVVANAQAESDWQKPVAKVAEPAPTPQPQSAPKQTPVLPMTSRLQKHHTDTTLLPLVALGLLTLFSGKRRRQHDDKK